MNVLDEQEKASEDADRDIGGVSNALCAVRSTKFLTKLRTIGLMTREAADQEGIVKFKFVHNTQRSPLSCKVVDESKVLKVLMNQPAKWKFISYGLNENGATRDAHHNGMENKNAGKVGKGVKNIVKGSQKSRIVTRCPMLRKDLCCTSTTTRNSVDT